MSRTVTAIITAGRNYTIDYNAIDACSVVIKMFVCIKITWDRAGNMFRTVHSIITTIWKPGFIKQRFHLSCLLVQQSTDRELL